MKNCMRCYVSGRVQGVWYRAHTKARSDQLGITGWARNLPDGRVEVFACGSSKNLGVLHQWLHQGSPLAQVTEVIREEAVYEELQGFNTY